MAVESRREGERKEGEVTWVSGEETACRGAWGRGGVRPGLRREGEQRSLVLTQRNPVRTLVRTSNLTTKDFGSN